MRKIKVYVFFAIVLASISCRNNTPQTREDFDDFYDKFLTDTEFQLDRIQFPLPGINTDEMSMDDTIYFWKKKNWEFFKKGELDTSQFQVSTIKSDSVVIEEISSKIFPSFIVKSKFELIDNQWHLTYFENVNL